MTFDYRRCTQPPHLCIVTEFCPLGSLGDHFQYAKTFRQILSLSTDIARGLDYLHQRVSRFAFLFNSEGNYSSRFGSEELFVGQERFPNHCQDY